MLISLLSGGFGYAPWGVFLNNYTSKCDEHGWNKQSKHTL